MRKRLALFTAAVGIIVAGVVAFMAFESYTLDINAHLEPVLSVNPHGDWDMGTVYPETERFTKLFVGLSNSAKADGNLISVAYSIGCQNKNADDLSLCPNIEFNDQQTGQILSCTVEEPKCLYIEGRSMDLAQNPQGYGIDIFFPDCIGAHQKEPGVKEVDCNLDRATGKYLGVDLQAQIYVQVESINQDAKCITDKQGNELPGCVKTSRPDLQPSFDGGTLLFDTPTPGLFACEVDFTITNKKGGDADASTTRVVVNGIIVDVATPAIGGNASDSDSVVVAGVCFGADFTGSITADFDEDIGENDEDNNVAEWNLIG